MFRISFKIEVGSWEMEVGIWEMEVGRWELGEVNLKLVI